MYEKRLCILRQLKKGFSADGAPLAGSIYLERIGCRLTVTPKITGLSPLKDGRYALALKIGAESFCLELRGATPLEIPCAPSLSGGFSALVCFVREKAEPIAFGSNGGGSDDPDLLLSVFSKKASPLREQTPRDEPEQTPPKTEEEPPREERASCAQREAPCYDDEAIASSDYFDEDKDGKSGDEGDGASPQEDECVHPFETTKGKLTYFRSIAPRIMNAMQKFPQDDALKGAFPHSQWVKTESGLLGIVYEEGLPRYLCVAMKTEPPQEVKEASVFVPIGPFDEAEGYFVVFQDADTGDYVRVCDA